MFIDHPNILKFSYFLLCEQLILVTYQSIEDRIYTNKSLFVSQSYVIIILFVIYLNYVRL